MYEYAAIAIGPNNSGDNFEVTKIAVGPSAPPIIEIAPDSFGVNPRSNAPINVINMPS